MGQDALVRKKKAEAILERAALQLKQLLQEAVAEVDLPYFLNSFTVQGIEVELSPVLGKEQGCVLLCPDGELYDYTYNIEIGEFTPSLDRKEKTQKLELAPADYIPYAYSALVQLAQLSEGKERD